MQHFGLSPVFEVQGGVPGSAKPRWHQWVPGPSGACACEGSVMVQKTTGIVLSTRNKRDIQTEALPNAAGGGSVVRATLVRIHDLEGVTGIGDLRPATGRPAATARHGKNGPGLVPVPCRRLLDIFVLDSMVVQQAPAWKGLQS